MFSVIIPAYNHSEFVDAAIKSALKSSLVGEVLVVDDGSSDLTSAIIADLARCEPLIRVLVNHDGKNFGAHVRLNQLVAGARNDWIAILNSDDEFVVGRFEAAKWSIERSGAELIFGDLILINRDGITLGYRRSILDNEYAWSEGFDVRAAVNERRWHEILLRQNIVASTTNMIFNKSLFQRIGGFRALKYCHDWDFAIRASFLGALDYTPTMISKYRIHDGNTIRTQRSNIEGDVRAMFRQLAIDFPAIGEEKRLGMAISENRYLDAAVRPWLEIVLSETPDFFHLDVAPEVYTRMGVVVNEVPQAVTLGESYIYAPGPDAIRLNANDLKNIRLALAVRSYDVVVISRGLKLLQGANLSPPRNAFIYKKGWGRAPGSASNYRFIRLLSGGDQCSTSASGGDLVGSRVDDAFQERAVFPSQFDAPWSLERGSLAGTIEKPVVFILPVYLARGGAERLVIETAKKLSDKYHFILITTEALSMDQGSMHSEAELVAEIYDIAEIVRREDRLRALCILKQQYDPVVVWICNGSPWHVENAKSVRAVFADVPIVDNQVYDHERGWINSLRDQNVRVADRYVAINKRIFDVMTNELSIPRSKIDLIYHGADISRWASCDTEGLGSGILERFSIPSGVPLFGMVGRLSPQKRPQDLVLLAERVHQAGDVSCFLWAGPGEMRDEIADLVERLKLPNFFLLPPLEDVTPIYARLDGLIITSEFEGLPFVMLEALALGVPVLATPVGAIEEVLNRYGSGMISGPPGDLEGLELAFFSFKERLSGFKEQATVQRSAFIEEFSSERMAREYELAWIRAIEDRKNAVN